MTDLNDIAGREDIERLVNSFYDKVKADEVIGHIFHKIIGEDWSHHLPVMYQFWETVILAKPGYTGNPVKKHIEIDKKIPLREEHYRQWLKLWSETVDAMFTGPNAREIKKRATLMMGLISMKVDWSRQDGSVL